MSKAEARAVGKGMRRARMLEETLRPERTPWEESAPRADAAGQPDAAWLEARGRGNKGVAWGVRRAYQVMGMAGGRGRGSVLEVVVGRNVGDGAPGSRVACVDVAEVLEV